MPKDKKQYYALDDIGIIGSQSKASRNQIKKEMDLTSQYFKTQKSGKSIAVDRSAKVYKSGRTK